MKLIGTIQISNMGMPLAWSLSDPATQIQAHIKVRTSCPVDPFPSLSPVPVSLIVIACSLMGIHTLADVK